MVIDTSVIVAILRREPERQRFLKWILSDSSRVMSAVTALESMLVMEGRHGPEGGTNLELFLYTAGIEVVPFDRRQAEAARQAWRRFGKGNHSAALNRGDCCTYALAKVTGEPLLSKGEDFPRTDIPLVPPG